MSDPIFPPTGNPSATNLRVFFALWPDAAARDVVAAMARDVVKREGGNAPRPENVHLTLAFVGDVAPDRVAALEGVGAAAARAAAPFTLALDRRGGFRETGIAWLGTDATPPELEAIMRRLNGGLAAVGFRVERRPFRVHVTLARKCRRPPAGIAVPPVAWRVERVTLTASELRPEGSRYREIATWPLLATPAAS